MTKTIEDRISSGKRRNDILQILLDTKQSDDSADRLSDIAIITETILFLIAGKTVTFVLSSEETLTPPSLI